MFFLTISFSFTIPTLYKHCGILVFVLIVRFKIIQIKRKKYSGISQPRTQVWLQWILSQGIKTGLERIPSLPFYSQKSILKYCGCLETAIEGILCLKLYLFLFRFLKRSMYFFVCSRSHIFLQTCVVQVCRKICFAYSQSQ